MGIYPSAADDAATIRHLRAVGELDGSAVSSDGELNLQCSQWLGYRPCRRRKENECRGEGKGLLCFNRRRGQKGEYNPQPCCDTG